MGSGRGSPVQSDAELRSKYMKRQYSKSSILGKGFDLDDSEDAPSYAEQILQQLRANSARVLDCFREMDEKSNDGYVRLEEFRFCMVRIGLDAPMSTIDELFHNWDLDGDGEISYQELKKVLTRSKSSHSPSPER